ncbi:MAG: Alkaline phosphatase precursor [candidate division BRC1 bacterium ADurb.BinA364]|nr:MAG: Alkaline phosphatase precursor [candidate division BRC1 bacterium ADurb.BinA364]
MRTAEANPAPFRFLYIGDAQNDVASHWSRAIRAAFAHAPDARFALHAGDLVNDGPVDALWGEWHEALGFIAASMPHVATPGNHEMDDAETDERLTPLWRPQFAFPLNGPEGVEELKETAYYFDYQGVRFVSFDSNHGTNSEQIAWLDRTLAENPHPWTIVFHHHPIYSSGKDRDNAKLRAALEPLYDKHGVDLVLQGHDHTYSRTYKLRGGKAAAPGEPGTVYAISVSGPKMYPINPLFADKMAVCFGYTQMYQIIDVDGSRLHYEAWSIDGRLRDAFELDKTAGLIELLAEASREIEPAPGAEGEAASEKAVVFAPEIMRTRDWPEAEIDSVAIWMGRDGDSPLLFATDKTGDTVYVCDAQSGELRSALGGSGEEPGRFRRPNGVAVVGDWLFVVERDNARVQMFALPSLEPVLAFGQQQLSLPYGIAAFANGKSIEAFITDNAEPIEGEPPVARVKHFRLRQAGDGWKARHVRSFAEADPAGGIFEAVESILADPLSGRLFVCDESVRAIRVFDLEGNDTGAIVGQGLIQDDPEGLAIAEAPNAPGGGWLVVADQGDDMTALRIFTRDGSRYIGAATGNPVLANTDGIALAAESFGLFRGGALYCVHDDLRVQGYAWDDIAEALGLAR